MAMARQCWDEARHIVMFRRCFEAPRRARSASIPVLNFQYRIITPSPRWWAGWPCRTAASRPPASTPSSDGIGEARQSGQPRPGGAAGRAAGGRGAARALRERVGARLVERGGPAGHLRAGAGGGAGERAMREVAGDAVTTYPVAEDCAARPGSARPRSRPCAASPPAAERALVAGAARLAAPSSRSAGVAVVLVAGGNDAARAGPDARRASTSATTRCSTGSRPGARATLRVPRTGQRTSRSRSTPPDIAAASSPTAPGARVAVYGDSFVEARFTPIERTFAARLQQVLAEGGRTVEVVNAGVTGYGPDQSALRMERELPGLAPRLVVLVLYAGNDGGDVVRNRLFRLNAEGRLEVHRPRLDPELLRRLSARRKGWTRLALVRAFRACARRFGGTASAEDARTLEWALQECRREHAEHLRRARTGAATCSSTTTTPTSALEPASEPARYKRAAAAGDARARPRRGGAETASRCSWSWCPDWRDVCADCPQRGDAARYPGVPGFESHRRPRGDRARGRHPLLEPVGRVPAAPGGLVPAARRTLERRGPGAWRPGWSARASGTRACCDERARPARAPSRGPAGRDVGAVGPHRARAARAASPAPA